MCELFKSYKLAPENPFPGPLNDCIKVVEFILDNSESMFLNIQKYVLAGDSAGFLFNFNYF
jgi:acetyl esterase